MNLRLRDRWYQMPRKTRIRLLVVVGMLLLGTEAVMLAPQVFEIAVMVDALGVTVMAGALIGSAYWSLLGAASQAQSLWLRRYFGLKGRLPVTPEKRGAPAVLRDCPARHA